MPGCGTVEARHGLRFRPRVAYRPSSAAGVGRLREALDFTLQTLFWHDILVSPRRSWRRNDRHRRVGGRRRLANPSISDRGRTNHARIFALTLTGWERGLGRRCPFSRRARCDITCCRMAGLDLCRNCGLCGRRRPWHGEPGLAVNRSAKQ